MSDEKIPCWVRKFSSLISRFDPFILYSKNLINRNKLEYILLRNRFSQLRSKKKDYKAISRKYCDRLLGERQHQYDFPSASQQQQSLQNWIPSHIWQTSAIIGLSLVCGFGMGCSKLEVRSSPPMAVGGALPDLPTAIPKFLPNHLGRKYWFDNRQGTHPLTDLPSSVMKGFCHPLQGKGFLSQGTRGSTHRGRMEYAYDFGVPIGMPVYAMKSGRVIGLRDIYPDKGGRRKNAEKFNFIWLEHSNGVRSAYIHLQQNFKRKIPIKLNDWVRTGELIGFSGNSGWSSAPHLHVEVHSISDAGFGQTLPFVIVSRCHTSPFASVRKSS